MEEREYPVRNWVCTHKEVAEDEEDDTTEVTSTTELCFEIARAPGGRWPWPLRGRKVEAPMNAGSTATNRRRIFVIVEKVAHAP